MGVANPKMGKSRHVAFVHQPALPYRLRNEEPRAADRPAVYIARQQEHHREMPFVREFRELLRKNNCAVDETFYWE